MKHDYNLNDLVHITRGYYKGQAGRIISKSLNSVSIKTSQGICTVNVGDVAAGSSPIPTPPADNIHPFKVGELVVIKRTASTHYGKRARVLGPDSDFPALARIQLMEYPHGGLTLYYSDLEKVLEVKVQPKEAPSIPTNRRVEGRDIDFADVKVGDTIIATRNHTEDGMEITTVRKGVVSRKGYAGIYTSEHGCLNPVDDTRLMLLKAVVEKKDDVLEKLKGYPSNTVLVFSTSVTFTYTAVKTGQTWILTASSGSTRTITSGKLREIIGTRKYTKVN